MTPAPRIPSAPPEPPAGRHAFPSRGLLPTLAAVLVGGTLAAFAGPAAAYVRVRTTNTLVPFFWADPHAALEISTPPAEVGISEKVLRAAAQVAVSAWSYPAIPCTGVALRLAGPPTDSQVSGIDGRNRIIMRTGAWCRDPNDTTINCRDPAAVAVTSTFSFSRPGDPTDGAIEEADIELNAASGLEWGSIPDGPISGRDFGNVFDLASVLTHEMGHFIGLDHVCLAPGLPLPGRPHPVDDQGMEIDSCSNLPPSTQEEIENATMYPFMSPADVRYRTLSPDETRAACEMYPFGTPQYQWTGTGGCALGPGRVGGGLAPVALIVFLAAAASLSRRPARSRKRGRRPRNPARTP